MQQFSVDDHSVKLKTGSQTIIVPDGNVLPLNLSRGLSCQFAPLLTLKGRPCQMYCWHLMLKWDPVFVDHKITDDEEWFDAFANCLLAPPTGFDTVGQLRRVAAFSDIAHAISLISVTLEIQAISTVPSRRSYA